MNTHDDPLKEIRTLAARLIDDNDDHPDDVAEQACRLARLVLDLDAALATPASRPIAAETTDAAALPIDAIIAVTDYLDEDERGDYRATPTEDRPGHIYRDVVDLRRWLRHCHRAALRPKTSSGPERAALAWAAVHALLDAYTRGRAAGGSIDWTDLDAAHAFACRAVAGGRRRIAR